METEPELVEYHSPPFVGIVYVQQDDAVGLQVIGDVVHRLFGTFPEPVVFGRTIHFQHHRGPMRAVDRHGNETGCLFAYGFRRSVRMSGAEKRFITRYDRIVDERTQFQRSTEIFGVGFAVPGKIPDRIDTVPIGPVAS